MQGEEKNIIPVLILIVVVVIDPILKYVEAVDPLEE